MKPENIKVIFIGAIVCVLWGGYNMAKSTYTAINWIKVEGTVVDFERHTMTCGKGVGECYSLVVGYHAGKNYFTVDGGNKSGRNKPLHMMDKKIGVYYSPTNPGEAVLGGSYGPMKNGIILFLIGSVVLLIFWVVRKKNQ